MTTVQARVNTLRREFIAVQHDIRHPYVVRINAEGQVVWRYFVDRALDVELLPGGGTLINGRLNLIEVDRDCREVWWHGVDGLELMSCRRLENGNTLTGDLTVPRICEVRPDRSIAWEIPYPHEPGEDLHFIHRMIRPLRNGNVIAASHSRNKVVEFARNGDVVWEHELEAGPYEPLELPNGNILVSLGSAGAIVEIARSEGIVWEFRMEEAGLERGWIAGICPLPDGHIVFSDSKWDRIIEINRSGEVVGMFHEPELLLHPASLAVVSPHIGIGGTSS